MANENLTKHTLFLREGDMDYIMSASPKGKASFVIRRLISNFVDRLREEEGPITDTTDLPTSL